MVRLPVGAKLLFWWPTLTGFTPLVPDISIDSLFWRRCWALEERHVPGVNNELPCMSAPLAGLFLCGGILLTPARSFFHLPAWSLFLSHYVLFDHRHRWCLHSDPYILPRLSRRMKSRYGEDIGVCILGWLAAARYNLTWLVDVEDLQRHDPLRVYLRPSSRKIPDFIGVSSSQEAWIFEAKGSVSPRTSAEERLNTAKTQVMNVRSVQWNGRFVRVHRVAVSSVLRPPGFRHPSQTIAADPPAMDESRHVGDGGGDRPPSSELSDDDRHDFIDAVVRAHYARVLRGLWLFEAADQVRRNGYVEAPKQLEDKFRDIVPLVAVDIGNVRLQFGFTKPVWTALTHNDGESLWHRLRQRELPPGVILGSREVRLPSGFVLQASQTDSSEA